MKIEATHTIVPLKNSPGNAQLVIRVRVNDEPAGGGTVVLSGNQADIEEFVAGTIDYAEIRKRWGFDALVYSVKAVYTARTPDPKLDTAIAELAGRPCLNYGFSDPQNERDLVFEYPCASQAVDAARRMMGIPAVLAYRYVGRLNVINETAEPF